MNATRRWSLTLRALALLALSATAIGSFAQCFDNLVTLELRTDANSDEASWEIVEQYAATVVCSGGGYAPNITNPITEDCCLPDGCYRLRVSDSGGDGFVSGGVLGGYELREAGINGRRIIDDLVVNETDTAYLIANSKSFNFEDLPGGPPDVSAISSTHDNGAFCVPIGTDRLISTSCDKFHWVCDQFIVATENAAVSGQHGVTNTTSGYEFWFYDPNGTYSYRRFRSHATSDGYGTGATRACHYRINCPQIPAGIVLNVRVRGRVAGVDQPFGPACLFMVDPVRASCPLVKLQDENYSYPCCDESRTFGGVNSSSNKIASTPPQAIPAVLSSNVRYQFRFRVPGESICIVRPPQMSPIMYLNWSALSGTQLRCNTTYLVEVRASLDSGASWCVDVASPSCVEPVTPWGVVCTIAITSSPFCPGPLQGGGSSLAPETTGGGLIMFPNPNKGDQLFLSLRELAADVETVSIDIFDLTGKCASARTISVQDGYLNTMLDLSGEIAHGVYVVNITAGEKVYTERLVIQP